jgi:hypothetical protein
MEVAQQAHDDRVARGYSFPQYQEKKEGQLNIAEIAAGTVVP